MAGVPLRASRLIVARTCDKTPKWLWLFFYRDGDRADGGEPYLVAFNAGDQAAIDIMVIPLVRSFSAILLGQLDPIALELATVPT
jgi:hypothetical protein